MYCVNGCKKPVVGEDLYGMSDDGLEIVDLICIDCVTAKAKALNEEAKRND